MSYSDFGSSAGSRFGKETVLVDELLQSSEEGYARGPERTLMAALLFDGLQSYMSFVCARTREAKNRYREAFNWVNSTENDYVFSFINVCEGLGIDPQFLKIGLANACTAQLVERKRARRHF